MDATANFSLRFARVADSNVEAADWVLSRQMLQRIATRLSLIGEAIGLANVDHGYVHTIGSFREELWLRE